MKITIKISTFLAIFIGYVHASSNILENNICFNMKITAKHLINMNVSGNESYLPELYINPNNENCLTVYANQKNTEGPVNWIKGILAQNLVNWNGGNMLCATNSNDSTPSKLNFAVYFDVIFDNKYECKNIAFGEGNSGGANMWLFSNYNDPEQNQHLVCNYLGQKTTPVRIHFKRNDNYYRNGFDLIVESSNDQPVVDYPI